MTTHNGEYKGVNYFDGNRPPDRRFHSDAPRKTWQVSKIWDTHAEIIRRVTLGQKSSHIAESMGLTPAQVSNVRNSPIIQERLAVMQGARDAYTIDIARDIREFAPKALDLLKEILQGEGTSGQLASPALKVSVAKDLLDRAGYAPIKSIDVRSVHAHLTKEDIEEMKKRAFEGSNAPLVRAERAA
jgi:hypothetical protein